MDRATKLIVVGWTAVALAVATWLASRGWSEVLPIAFVTFAGAAVLAWMDRRAVGVVLLFAYVFPVPIIVNRGAYYLEYEVLWLAPLFGAMLPDAVTSPWRIPVRWRPALVSWALVVVAGATLMVWREVDFSLMIRAPMPFARMDGGPTFGAAWVLHVGVVLLLGILWFDWLFGATDAEFGQAVVGPLALSALALLVVSAYQVFGDLYFLNTGAFGYTGRASGTLYDGNVAGAVAGMWVGASVLAAARWGWWRWPAGIAGVLLAWLAAWGSGSRSALIAAVVASAFNVIAFFAAQKRAPRKYVIRRVALGSAAIVALLIGLRYAPFTTASPLERILFSIPDARPESLRAFVAETWNRNQYGSTAMAMIREFPLVGIGVGQFHRLLDSFGGPTVPDNAQNWYRHQFAELGVIGSLAWIVWVLAFAAFVLRARTGPPLAWSARGIVIAFALISLVGVPGQHIAAAITFWTAAFWYVSLVGIPDSGVAVDRRAWLLILVVPIAFAIGTVGVNATGLSVMKRVERVTAPRWYGFDLPERDSSGEEFRWTRHEAAAVIDAPSSWIVIKVGVSHPDIEQRPVDVYVWLNRALVIKTRLQDATPVTRLVHVERSGANALIETWVSHAFLEETPGGGRGRERGMKVSWRFVGDPDPLRTRTGDGLQ